LTLWKPSCYNEDMITTNHNKGSIMSVEIKYSKDNGKITFEKESAEVLVDLYLDHDKVYFGNTNLMSREMNLETEDLYGYLKWGKMIYTRIAEKAEVI